MEGEDERGTKVDIHLFLEKILLEDHLSKKYCYHFYCTEVPMGSHHNQVAILVSDDTLDCFGQLENFFA